MAYLDTLRVVRIPINGQEVEVVAGSFRRVPFFVASHQLGTGRRIAVHEYPGLGDPFNEDLGRASRSISLEGYLLGDDVQDQKHKLISACETAGAGVLIHPYMGSLTVKCSDLKISENAKEKRWVGVALTFVKDPKTAPAAKYSVDKKATAKVKAAAGIYATKSNFSKSFSLLKAAKSTVQAAVDLTNKALDQVEALRDTMRDVAEFVEKIKQVRANIDLLLMTPGDFANRIEALIASTVDAVSFGSTEEKAKFARSQLLEGIKMSTMLVNTKAVPNQTAVERRKQAQNQAALVSLFQEIAAHDTANKLVDAKVTSVQDAGTLQESMAAAYETLLEGTDNPDAYQTIQDTEAAALAYLRETSADLAVVLTVTPERTVPSLVLSFEIYGTNQRAQDLVDRNGIQHPGFIRGGKSLEVLSK